MNDLDPISDPDLAFLVEPAPVPNDGAARARARGTHLRRRRVVGAVAAGLCAVLVLTALAVSVRMTHRTASTADHRPPSVPHVDPPLPKGWRHVDWGDLRFAVPGDWTVRTGSPCPGGDVGLTNWSSDLAACVKLADGRQVVVTLHAPIDGTCKSTARVNGLRVYVPCGPAAPPQLDPATCPATGCTLQTVDRGDQLTIRIADPAVRSKVIRSITTSPAYRAVHDGPTLDTRRWRTVTGAGITMRVPSSWQMQRLGPTTGYGFCADGPTPRRALVGGRPEVPSCPVLAGYEPWGNATWSRRPVGTDASGIAAATRTRLTVNGHRLIRVSGEGAVIDPYPRFALVVGDRRHPSVVTLSIGGDPDVSRTILTTIRPSR